MKVLVFFSLFFLIISEIQSRPSPDDPDPGPYQTIFGRQLSRALARHRRMFIADDSQAAVECAGACAKKMKEDMERELPGEEVNNPVPPQYDPQKLAKVCKIHDTAKTCLNQCPNSTPKEMMQKAMAMMQYMCHDSNFKENTQCLNEVNEETKGTCEADAKCGKHKKNIEEQQNVTTEAQLTEMTKNSCLLMKCTLDCGKPSVVQKCGQVAQDDLEGLITKAAEFLKHMLDKVNLVAVFPQECRQLIP